jgi:hypothetical protein
MSKKRGLSVDEKRAIVLDIFHESNQAWLLKARVAARAWRCRAHGWAATQRWRKRRAARVFALGALWVGQLLCVAARRVAPAGSCSRAPSSASLKRHRVPVFSHGARARHRPPR